MTDADQSRRLPRRCAIYTRKSSEEGLEQGFNSLDAQREACAAYIISQKAEGWKALAASYDDGGFSGGSMERPALKRLMADITAGRFDVVVVYKIDRLTRSLADFARMVELFDRRAVSFVSVTQAFSTTTSMGRLTLNVLLSFAQFEREVTGERIRDKIAASKKKGLWMGGTLPLGYDLPNPGTRVLQVNKEEASLVRTIFARYLDLGSVHALERELNRSGALTKVTQGGQGAQRGGVPFSRGALFHLLRNRLYLGQIPHKGQAYPGQHEPIIPSELFKAVQSLLDSQSRRHRKTTRLAQVAPSPLTGRIVDADGQPMSPAFSYGRNGKIYRYYVSAPLQQGRARTSEDSHPRRVPAAAIESTLISAITAHWGASNDPLPALVQQVAVLPERLVIDLNTGPDHHAGPNRLVIPFQSPVRARRHQITPGKTDAPRRDPVLIRALRQAHAGLRHDSKRLPTLNEAPATFWARRILRLAFLAPDLQRAILNGAQPPHITLATLINAEIPLLWAEQRRLFALAGDHPLTLSASPQL